MRGDNTPDVLLAGWFYGVVASWKGKVAGPIVPAFVAGFHPTTITKTGPGNVKVVVIGVTRDGLVDEEAFAPPTENSDAENALGPVPLGTALRGADFGIGSLAHTLLIDHTNLTKFPGDLPSVETRAEWKKWFDLWTAGATAAADDDERVGTQKRPETPVNRFVADTGNRGTGASASNAASKRPRGRSASPGNKSSTDRAASLAASRQALQRETLEDNLKAARVAAKQAAVKHALVRQLRHH